MIFGPTGGVIATVLFYAAKGPSARQLDTILGYQELFEGRADRHVMFIFTFFMYNTNKGI